MIGTCEACSKVHVPVRLWRFSGMDTIQCFRCIGDAEADPYGELECCDCPVCIAKRDAEVIRTMVAVAKRDKPDECEYPNCKCPRVGRCGIASRQFSGGTCSGGEK